MADVTTFYPGGTGNPVPLADLATVATTADIADTADDSMLSGASIVTAINRGDVVTNVSHASGATELTGTDNTPAPPETGTIQFWTGTEAEYLAIITKNADTIYFQTA